MEYVDDYTIETYVDEKGREKDKIVYIGPEVPFSAPASVVRPRLIICAVLAVLTVLAVVSTQLIIHGSQNSAFVMFPLAVALFPSMYLLMGVMNFKFNAKPMTRDQYKRGILRVFHSCGGIIVLTLVAFVGDFVYRIPSGDWLFLRGDIIFYIVDAAAFGACLACVLILRTIGIDERAYLTAEAKKHN